MRITPPAAPRGYARRRLRREDAGVGPLLQAR